MRSRTPFTVVFVLVMVLGAAAWDTALTVEPSLREAVTIKGTTYDVVPDGQLRAMGFELPDVAPDENAATYYLQALNAYWSLKGRDELRELREHVLHEGWTDDAAPLALYLEKNEKTLNLIEQAAAAPICRFPILVGKDVRVNAASISGALVSQLADMRELARFAVTVGRAREAEGEFAGAIEAYCLAIRIGNDIGQSPFLVSGLVGIACNGVGAREIERCLVSCAIDEKTLSTAHLRFHELGERAPDLMVAIRGEHVFSLTEDLGGMTAQARKDAREFWAVMDPALAMPLPDFIRTGIGDKLTRDGEVRPIPPNVIAPLGAALQRARAQYGRDTLVWNVLDAEFALARCEIGHGKYPGSLDALKDFTLSASIDPFSGERLRYRLEDDGSYTIWSVGEDLADDGGEVGDRSPDWDADDYVWNSAVIGRGR